MLQHLGGALHALDCDARRMVTTGEVNDSDCTQHTATWNAPRRVVQLDGLQAGVLQEAADPPHLQQVLRAPAIDQ